MRRVARRVVVFTHDATDIGRVGPQAEQRAVNGLRDDLSTGRWVQRNRDLVTLDAAELGLRLLVA